MRKWEMIEVGSGNADPSSSQTAGTMPRLKSASAKFNLMATWAVYKIIKN